MKNSIAFDLDGVLYEWHDIIHTWLLFNKPNINPDYNEFWKNEWFNYSEKFWGNVANIRHIYNQRSIRTDILSLLNKLSEEYKIYYITKRGEELEEVTRKWFKWNSLPQSENLHFVSSKRDLIDSLKINYLVEDRIDIIDTCKDVCNCFLVSQPWNIKIEEENCIRLNTIFELKEYLL